MLQWHQDCQYVASQVQLPTKKRNKLHPVPTAVLGVITPICSHLWSLSYNQCPNDVFPLFSLSVCRTYWGYLTVPACEVKCVERSFTILCQGRLALHCMRCFLALSNHGMQETSTRTFQDMHKTATLPIWHQANPPLLLNSQSNDLAIVKIKQFSALFLISMYETN